MRPALHRALLALTLALAIPGVGSAAAGLDIRLQQAIGGDNIATVDYSNGSSYDLTLGTYTGFSAGGWVTPVEAGPHALVVEGLLGFGSWSTGPENTDDRMVLRRMPVEALAFYRYAPDAWPVALQLGGGAAWHLTGTAHGVGALEGETIDVGNGLGLVAEANVLWEALSFTLRYNAISHRVGTDEVLDGSGLALAVGLYFPL